MDQSRLEQYIKRLSVRIPDEDLPLLTSFAQYRYLKKGELLLKEGVVPREFYLVDEGYLRTWCYKDEAAINLSFTFEGEFMANLKNLKGRLPSTLSIEAGEPSAVWVFNLEAMTEEDRMHPKFVVFIQRLAVNILMASEKHSDLFKLYTPAERYRYIEENNPQLLQRVSLSQLASYLGVSRETLSRIRAKNH